MVAGIDDSFDAAVFVGCQGDGGPADAITDLVRDAASRPAIRDGGRACPKYMAFTVEDLH
jgi:hypothetical protein